MLIFKKEKEARRLVLKHLKTVQECLTESRNGLEHYIAGNVEGTAEKGETVSHLESEADDLVREVREVLLSGAFLPHIRSDVYRLVGAVDVIGNKAEGLTRFLVDQPPALPDEFKTDLLVLYQHSLDCFSELREALMDYFKPKGVLENLHVHVTRVSELESEVDVMQSALNRKVFASTLDLAQKMHLEQLIHRMADVADLSEDAADELEFAAMKSVV